MAETRTLKVGIAGLGVGSTQIIPAMAQMPGMRLVAAADFRKDALEIFKQKYGGRAYDSVEKLCDDPEVEAVWVSTPNQFHCEHVLAAAERGKHVVVEAVTQDRPVYHDGRWGMATLEACLALMQSARERREILLTHQSPTSDH